ncbi:MAG: ATP-binding cassette domain-containing protein [Kiritimatiellaeota bacterium]|nr:ATP-binding cassette domain-containing protein [Kiritimatiellota bacterium]
MTSAAVIKFDRVSCTAQPPYEQDLAEVSLALGPGELGVVLVPPGVARLPLADLAEGLLTPESGTVSLDGEDWRELTPDAAAAARSQIGRVFETRGWISNLDVDENITLAQRHHTLRPLAELDQEAEALARGFGLTELPRVRPATLKGAVLRRAEWVRAFLGAPTLILLEYPMRDVYTNDLDGLLRAVQAARERGAAVLWIGEASGDGGRAAGLPAAQVWTLEGARLIADSLQPKVKTSA